jgi:hypothetical protein
MMMIDRTLAPFPHRKCPLSHHFNARFGHDHLEQKCHASDLIALYQAVTDSTILTTDVIPVCKEIPSLTDDFHSLFQTKSKSLGWFSASLFLSDLLHSDKI